MPLLGVCALLVSATKAGGDDWIDLRRKGPVVCYAEFSWETQPWVFQELLALHGELMRVLGMPPVEHPVQVYCYRDKKSYWQNLQRHWPEVPYRRALYVKGQAGSQVFAFNQRELAVDLRHEVTHAFLNEAVGTLPLWLDEGLAEYFEMAASHRANGHPSLARVQRWLAEGSRPFSLQRLEAKQELSEMDGDDYREAWAWVHFMLHGPPEAQQDLVAYLREVAADRGEPTPLSQRLAARYPNLAGHLAAHFRPRR